MAACGVCDRVLGGLRGGCPVACPNAGCDFAWCRDCGRRYALEDAADAARCMVPSCQAPLGPAASTSLGKTWMQTVYRRHQAQRLLDAELARMPDTMNDVPAFLAAEAVENEENEAKEEAKRARAALRVASRRYENAVRARVVSSTPWSGPRLGHQYPCPHGECRGFVGPDWTCGICRAAVCERCLAALDGGDGPHTCREDAIASVQTMRSLAKPCPGCARPIERSTGCPQMYCTQCRCRWDWNTLQIHIRGAFHNPHLAEAAAAQQNARGQQSALGYARARRASAHVVRWLNPLAIRLGTATRDTAIAISPAAQMFVSAMVSRAAHERGVFDQDDARTLLRRGARRTRMGALDQLSAELATAAAALAERASPATLEEARRTARVKYALGRTSEPEYRTWLGRTAGDAALATWQVAELEGLREAVAAALQRLAAMLHNDGSHDDGCESPGFHAIAANVSMTMRRAQAAITAFNARSETQSRFVGRATRHVDPDTYHLAARRPQSRPH